VFGDAVGSLDFFQMVNAFRMAVPWLRLLVAGLSQRRHGFATSVHVGFVVDKVALGTASLPSSSVFL
jgi:hypothetical protein